MKKYNRFTEDNLPRADFCWDNLSKANLSRADLSKANLSRADLSKANLSRANISMKSLQLLIDNLVNNYLLEKQKTDKEKRNTGKWHPSS